jgi:hypothetical protein
MDSRPESMNARIGPLASAQRIPPADATPTVTGLFYRVLRSGQGEDRAGPRDRAVLRVRRWDAIGNPIETVDRLSVLLDHTEPALAEAAQIMVVGGSLRLWTGGSSGRQVIDVELLAFERTEPPRVVPVELRSPRGD